MQTTITLISLNKKSIVKINKGELISYLKDREELIHQKGNAGWRNSDTEMFPLIGPTEQNNFTVTTPKGNCIQDQHGLLRELEYTILNNGTDAVSYKKTYKANTIVKNSKYPEKSTAENLFWKYDFNFTKSYELNDDSLKITFEIESENGMPFMLGYHPAFMLNGKLDEIVKTDNHEVSIQEIMNGGSTAYSILDTESITLQKKEGQNIQLKTKGFHNFMLWTEVSNMLCIEPITAYPYTGEEMLGSQLFNISNGNEGFSLEITPIH